MPWRAPDSELDKNYSISKPAASFYLLFCTAMYLPGDSTHPYCVFTSTATKAVELAEVIHLILTKSTIDNGHICERSEQHE